MSLHGTWWEKLGREPRCFGQFVQGQPKCDGYPPCSHLLPCRDWRTITSVLDGEKAAPSEFREMVTEDGFQRILYQNHRKRGVANQNSIVRINAQWNEFFDALKGVLPASKRFVAPSPTIASLGALYVEALEQKGKLPEGWRLEERTLSGSFFVAEYRTRPFFTKTPTIKIRMNRKRLSKMAPWVESWAESWSEEDGATVASRVAVDRVLPFARMIGRFWLAGVLDDQHNEHQIEWKGPLAGRLG